MNEIKTTAQLYTGGIGWTGAKRHIIRVDEDSNGDFRGRPYALCADAFRWDGTRKPTQIKKEAPTVENVNCRKCLVIVARIEARTAA